MAVGVAPEAVFLQGSSAIVTDGENDRNLLQPRKIVSLFMWIRQGA